MIISVEKEQLEELLRQNKEMKEDIFLLLASLNYFADFLPKDLLSGAEPPSITTIMFKAMPLIKQMMEQSKSPQFQFVVSNLKNLHSKYAEQIQQPSKQIENGAKQLSPGAND